MKSAAIYVFSLAHYCIVYARARAADSINARVRLAAQNDRLHEACVLLREELRIKVAETLCRAGLHLGVTTVGRILKEEPQPNPGDVAPRTRVVTAKHPNHVWHVDLTAVPTLAGFWAPWLPFALPQCWPFSWWVAVVIDHYSRRLMDTVIFSDEDC